MLMLHLLLSLACDMEHDCVKTKTYPGNVVISSPHLYWTNLNKNNMEFLAEIFVFFCEIIKERLSLITSRVFYLHATARTNCFMMAN